MFGSFIRKQFIDVIEWPDPEDDQLIWRYPAIDREIQTGATQLIALAARQLPESP